MPGLGSLWFCALPWAGSQANNDERPGYPAVSNLARVCLGWSLDWRCVFRPISGLAFFEGRIMTMTMGMCITACISAFGVGYAGGSLIRIGRKAIESLD